MRSVLLFLMLFGLASHGFAELTGAQKQALFLKSKKSTSTSTKAKTSTSTHQKKKTHSSSTSSSSSSRKKKSASSSSSSHVSKEKTVTATPPTTFPSATSPHDIVVPINPSTASTVATAPITIEKSGILQDQGLQPMPTPLPKTKHGWWIFSRDDSPAASYQYVTPAIRRAIDHAPVRHGRWKYIIVHNSGTRAGNAHSFDIYHRKVRHMVNGLAYHFVIGDGVSSGNGQIEIGHRWTAQLNGGHVASDYLNDISLGICLVGDYNHDVPTKAQLTALNELITYLRLRVGKVQGHSSVVKAHKEINPRPTDCPGTHFPYRWLHHEFDR